MSNYLKVDSDTSLIRDMESGAIINTNKSEYDKFMKLSKKKYHEKQEMNKLNRKEPFRNSCLNLFL